VSIKVLPFSFSRTTLAHGSSAVHDHSQRRILGKLGLPWRTAEWISVEDIVNLFIPKFSASIVDLQRTFWVPVKSVLEYCVSSLFGWLIRIVTGS